MSVSDTTARCPECEIKVFEKIRDLTALRAFWEKMQWHPDGDIDLYSSRFTCTSNGKLPCVLVAFAQGIPVAMMSGIIEHRRMTFRIGYARLISPTVRMLTFPPGGTTYGATEQYARIFVSALSDQLTSKKIEAVHFKFLKWNSTLCNILQTNLSFKTRYNSVTHNLHWKTVLPETLDAFYHKLPSKTRHELFRKVRLIERQYANRISCVLYRNKQDIDTIVRDAEQVAQFTYQRGLQAGFSADNEIINFLYAAASQGNLRAYLLYIDKSPVSFWIGVSYQHCLYLYYTGYDPAYRKVSPGVFLLRFMIENLYESGDDIREIDFGSGDARYKQELGDYSFSEVSVYVFSATLYGILLNGARTFLSLASKLLEGTLIRLGVRDKVKSYWRRSLSLRQRRKRRRRLSE